MTSNNFHRFCDAFTTGTARAEGRVHRGGKRPDFHFDICREDDRITLIVSSGDFVARFNASDLRVEINGTSLPVVASIRLNQSNVSLHVDALETEYAWFWFDVHAE